MLSNYKIKVNIEIVESEEEVSKEPISEKEGVLEFVIEGKDGESIDACEQALLKTAYPALREILGSHLSQVAKKKFWKKELT